jgi:hypothetical protein
MMRFVSIPLVFRVKPRHLLYFSVLISNFFFYYISNASSWLIPLAW